MALVSPSNLDTTTDYFSVFELKPSFALDLTDLERRFYQLAKSLHPDRFVNHPDPLEKTRSIEKMSLLNHAYQTLKSSSLRRDYLLEYFRVPQSKPFLPADLAEEWFDVQDEPASPQFKAFSKKLNEREANLKVQLENLEKQFDQTGNVEVLEKISALVQNVAYLRSLGRDVALKSETHSHV